MDTLSAVYSNLEGLAARAAVEQPNTPVSNEDGQHAANAYLGLNRGLTHLGTLVAAPPRYRLVKRLTFQLRNRAHLAKLGQKDARLRDPAETLREHARRAADL